MVATRTQVLQMKVVGGTDAQVLEAKTTKATIAMAIGVDGLAVLAPTNGGIGSVGTWHQRTRLVATKDGHGGLTLLLAIMFVEAIGKSKDERVLRKEKTRREKARTA